MGINSYRPHLLVLPEDEADRQIVNGFRLDPDFNSNAMQDLLPAGGWPDVVSQFTKNHVGGMRKYHERRILLLIDFDENEHRFEKVRADIPEDLRARVFILGVWSTPEDLRRDTKKPFEKIGEELARDCSSKNYNGLWQHELLVHNIPELDRLITEVRPFLFPK
jgi:hypothetical protein